MKPMLEVRGAFNLCDLGGLQTTDEKVIKRQKLLKGGYLTDVDDQGLLNLYSYGVRTILDLRSPSEIERYPDRVLPSMTYQELSIFDDDPTSSTMSDQQINRIYAQDAQFGQERMLRSYRKMILDHHAIRAYKRFFEALITYGPKGCLFFHCSAGKDRTGFCTYLLLSILGVPASKNVDFYLAANENSRDRIAWRLSEAKKMQLGRSFVNSVHDLVVVKPEYLEQATSLIQLEFGSANMFIKDVIGVTEAQVSELKRLYLESK